MLLVVIIVHFPCYISFCCIRDIPQHTHFTLDEYFGCFQLWAVSERAAVNFAMDVPAGCVHIFLLLGIVIKGVSCYIVPHDYSSASIMSEFPREAVRFPLPPAAWELGCSPSLWTFGVLHLFDFGYSGGMQLNLIVVLIWFSRLLMLASFHVYWSFG